MKESLDNRLNLKKKIIFSLLTCILVFFVIEWLGRIWVSWGNYKKENKTYQADDLDTRFHQMLQRDPDIGYFFYTKNKRTLGTVEFKNEYYFINLGVDSLFFRDNGINFERKKRLLAIGGSFVWGLGVELNQIFTDVMEEMDKDLKVLNGGMPGFTPQQYTRVIKRFIKNHIPFDGVIYCFSGGSGCQHEYTFREWSENIKRFPNLAPPLYMKNELIAYKATQYELAKRVGEISTLGKNSWQGFVNSFVKDWFASSRLLGQLYRSLHNGSETKSGNNDWYVFPGNPMTRGTNGEKIKLRTDYINGAAGETLSQSRLDYEAIHKLNFPLAIESIVEAKNICDSLNKNFYFVYVPSKEEVYADALCSVLEEPLRTQIREKMNHLHQAILEACKSRNIKVIDLYDECIRRVRKGDQLYYNIDSHWTKNGHRVAAEVISAYIANKK